MKAEMDFFDTLVRDRDLQAERANEAEELIDRFLKPLIKKYGKKEGEFFVLVLTPEETAADGKIFYGEKASPKAPVIRLLEYG